MMEPARIIDESVKDEIARYSTVEMIRKLFPDVKVHGRSTLCNPLRGERHASLSCFRSRSGYPRWKDHSTGQEGDNLDFYRLVYPGLSYPEAVDGLSRLLLGRSAYREARPGESVGVAVAKARSVRASRAAAPEPDSALRVVGASWADPARVPRELVGYWRSRGISDEVASRYCHYVTFENTNIRGRYQTDPQSGVPVTGPDGAPLHKDGRSEALGFPNDIGGYAFRAPRTADHEPIKLCDRQFVSTILADGSAPASTVRRMGADDALVSCVRYDSRMGRLWTGGTTFFEGVSPVAAPFAVRFLEPWMGRYLEGRELVGVMAVLNALNTPKTPAVTVVEGAFDALSVIEVFRGRGHETLPPTDLVVLNSLTNLPWAVPFLSMHREVVSMLDNDLVSGAGQKAYADMARDVSAFAASVGMACTVRSCSYMFSGYKDMNEYLVASRAAEAQKKTKPAPVVSASRGVSGSARRQDWGPKM